ncbi:hypothetical protein B4Q13_25245, partial [Lacticaseibacillus rhamnosus]
WPRFDIGSLDHWFDTRKNQITSGSKMGKGKASVAVDHGLAVAQNVVGQLFVMCATKLPFCIQLPAHM